MPTIYLREPIGDDGVIHAVARFEGGGGMVGDASVTIRPDDTPAGPFAGVTYAQVLDAMKRDGQFTPPPAA